jgi:hypothetical protein
MRISVVLAGVCSLFLVAGGAHAAKQGYSGDLVPAGEIEAPVLGGKNPVGFIKASYDDQTKRLCGEITYKDLTSELTGVHMHQAPAGDPFGDGTANKIVLPVGASPIKFNIALPAAWERSLKTEHPDDDDATELYANVHTKNNTKGEIRTSLFPDGRYADYTCPPETPTGGGDAGAGDGGAGARDGGAENTSSSSGGTGSSSGSTEEPSSGASSLEEDAGALVDPSAKPAADSGGCNTSGSGSGMLSLGVLAGLAAVVAGRLRRGKR